MHMARYQGKMILPNWISYDDLVQECELSWHIYGKNYDETKGPLGYFKFQITRAAFLNILIKQNGNKRAAGLTKSIDDIICVDDLATDEKWDYLSIPSNSTSPFLHLEEEEKSKRLLANIDKWINRNFRYIPHRPIVRDILCGPQYRPGIYHSNSLKKLGIKTRAELNKGIYQRLATKHKTTRKAVDNIAQQLRRLGKSMDKEQFLKEMSQ